MRVNESSGFTLIELMVSIAVIGIISGGVYLRNIRDTRDHASEETCRYSRNVIVRAEQNYFLRNQSHSNSFQDLADAGLIRQVPECPSGGVYAWLSPEDSSDILRSQVVCSVHGGYSEKPPEISEDDLPASSDHFTVHFTRTNEIISYDGEAGNQLVLPNEIDGTTITAITGQGGRGAFQGKDLEYVLLPETLISIGNQSFRDNKLTSIELPDGIITIGISAFSGNQISEIIIPDTVRTVGASAFHENPITKITIGDGVEIGDTYSFGIHRPGGQGNFNNLYASEAGGGGTYIYNGQSWIKID